MVRRINTELHALWQRHVGKYSLSEQDELEYVRVAKVSRMNRYQLYLMTQWWSKMRARRLEQDKNKCVRCGSELNLHVDHIWYRGFGKEWLEDLQTLCSVCHAKKTQRYDLLSRSGSYHRQLEGEMVSLGRRSQLFEVMRR
jgi:5-methylcytosine-specific restriction endonuclease McrA